MWSVLLPMTYWTLVLKLEHVLVMNSTDKFDI